MKKISILFIIVFLTLFSLPVYAADTNNLPLGIDINGDVSLGNTNANISLGGYTAPSKGKSNQRTFYAYSNPSFDFYADGSRAGQGLIKAYSGTFYLSYGFNYMYINNYNEEWIFFMKNNDGCIYKVKTDGTKETKLELPFFVKRFLLVNDRLIIETQFCEYGKILSTDLNGDDLRLIAKCDPRFGDMMIQADVNGVYYYDDVNLELCRICYDGKEKTLIFKGEEISDAPVLLFQVCGNKIIIRTYDNYNMIRTILLDLNKPLENMSVEEYRYSHNFNRTGVPLFDYQPLYILDDNCFNFSDDGCFVLLSVKPENYILGYDELAHLPDDYYVYKLDLNYIDEINNGINWGDSLWEDEVFMKAMLILWEGTTSITLFMSQKAKYTCMIQ